MKSLLAIVSRVLFRNCDFIVAFNSCRLTWFSFRCRWRYFFFDRVFLFIFCSFFPRIVASSLLCENCNARAKWKTNADKNTCIYRLMAMAFHLNAAFKIRRTDWTICERDTRRDEIEWFRKKKCRKKIKKNNKIKCSDCRRNWIVDERLLITILSHVIFMGRP